MQEDTESFNENSNSEVIILPQNAHLEETLISDEDETDNETPHSYDDKLNAKLKDLDLYEDGMTIQQKEELLAVVAVSFKTAEEEKSRRRWYEEYATFPEEEFPTKTSCYPGDYECKTENSEVEGKVDSSASVVGRSSNSDDYHDLPSTSQSTSYKSKSHSRKNRIRGSYKVSLDEGNTVTSHSDFNSKEALLTINKQRKHFLEKSMSLWKPCLSPKDEPLVCSSRLIPEEKVKMLTCIQPIKYKKEDSSELKPSQSVRDYTQDFSFASTEIKRTNRNLSHFGKPYHLTRNGHCLKKANKLDSLDMMVGVQEGRNDSESGASNFVAIKKEPFSRTSRGAFRYAQLHRDRIDALRVNSAIVNNHTSSMTSDLRYSIQKTIGDCRTYPEIVVEDGIETADIPLPDSLDSNASGSRHTEQFNCEDDAKNVFDTKLPKFSNLRPDLCRDGLSEKDVLSRHASLTYNTMNCTDGSRICSTYRKENHIDSSSQDGELSDSSSVIDVETIVDDEIEEFVLKRKLLQEPIVSDRQTYSNRPKRLKKNT